MGILFYKSKFKISRWLTTDATRIMKMKKVEKNIPQREVKTPDGFAITIAYNKSGYQVIPKEDLKKWE